MDGPGPEVQNGRNSPPSAGPFGCEWAVELDWSNIDSNSYPDSFLGPMDTPYEQAPALPPGPSLLDDNESNMLDNFFTTMNTNNFNNDFWLRSQQQKSSSLSFDWADELPPTFQGSTTSLPQPSFQPHSLDKSGILAGNAANHDIYAAASMLYPDGIHGPDLGSALAQQTFARQPLPINNHPRRSSQPAPVTQTHNSSPVRPQIPTGFHTEQMLFDVRDPIPADQHPSRKIRGLHWGSDVSFMDQGYVAPPDQPDIKAVTRDLLDHLDCFEPQTSAGNTRGSHPRS
ncbi:transcriptional regulator family: Helix-loop-helix [Penicillium chermesinum]|uniref:Transcriptional regulator family: Helix-loop-helix n=1 Tax=Penicillium chermesinum TaxID=63820 RepID=A0A9W9NPL5_9EURO|nr:transcriptional regulator family: Helix-loop-helix [Penicillium chermesinum]KAJ5223831.1 transcriptional regulator family: Helix-loop-helix [Penicillium chermesinum]